jgi:hypothetical protein
MSLPRIADARAAGTFRPDMHMNMKGRRIR